MDFRNKEINLLDGRWHLRFVNNFNNCTRMGTDFLCCVMLADLERLLSTLKHYEGNQQSVHYSSTPPEGVGKVCFKLVSRPAGYFV